VSRIKNSKDSDF